LFNDIAPTHWLYSHYPHHFFSGMACLGKRDANQLEERVKETLNDLPWAAKSLPKINHFASTSDIFTGFGYVPQILAQEVLTVLAPCVLHATPRKLAMSTG